MYKVYKLIYKGDIVYIGMTILDLRKRKYAGYRNTVPFYRECNIELIEETYDKRREKYWILWHIDNGYKLLNKLLVKKPKLKKMNLSKEEKIKRVKINNDKSKEYRRIYYIEYRKSEKWKNYIKIYNDKKLKR